MNGYIWSLSLYSSQTTDYVVLLNPAGATTTQSPNVSYRLRPMITLKSNIEYISGNGTIESPYEIWNRRIK